MTDEIVEVIWLDACGEVAHIPLARCLEFVPIRRRNVGYVLRADKNGLLLVAGDIKDPCKGENEKAYDWTQLIPWGMIEHVTRLNRAGIFRIP